MKSGRRLICSKVGRNYGRKRNMVRRKLTAAMTTMI
nr:MAG TPA: hypothetical protein [Caudoviricetes sp.]